MKHFNFPVRNLDGTFYAQVHPFDPSFFAVKVHPSGVLLFTPHHSQLTLLQHIILQAPFLKKPVQFLADTPKYWLEDDGTMCLHPSHRWKSDDTIGWLRKRGLHSVATSIKAEIGDLVYNGPKLNDDSTASTSPPGRFFFLLRAPFGQYGPVAAFELYLYTAVDSRPGPGGSRTTASCQP